MDLHLTGSYKILEIKSCNLHFVIKSKNLVCNEGKISSNKVSKLKIISTCIDSVKILGQENISENDEKYDTEEYIFDTIPLFFEQNDYEIIVYGKETDNITLWHENKNIRNKISSVTDGGNIISGVINFENDVGFSNFEISINGTKVLSVCVEIFMSKVTYKDDYRNMFQDILNEVYEEFSAENSQEFKFADFCIAEEGHQQYLKSQGDLSLNGDVFKLSPKDTAQLYEYWCFIKLLNVLKKKYKIVSEDITKVDNFNITIDLDKDKITEINFINTKINEKIILTYKPIKSDVETNFKYGIGNIITLEKIIFGKHSLYIFSPKYKQDMVFQNNICSDNVADSVILHINNVCEYRDLVVRKNTNFLRSMAYVLLPYKDADEYENNAFYQNVKSENIGVFPFLSGSTEFFEEFLKNEILNPEELMLEKISLSKDIEEKLKQVDWSKRDVLVGTARSAEQLKFNLQNNCYYTPKKYIVKENLPINFIALYEHRVGRFEGIRYYGEVLTTTEKRRNEIPVSMHTNNGDEIYCYFAIKNWIALPRPIELKDSYRGKPQFTNLFLLENCNKSYQLFSIKSAWQYCLLTELVGAIDNNISKSLKEDVIYRIGENYSVYTTKGELVFIDDKGKIIEKIRIDKFKNHPRNVFKRIKDAINRLKK